ncbi:hypothetical protein D3C71_1667120 [compost metagenome]
MHRLVALLQRAPHVREVDQRQKPVRLRNVGQWLALHQQVAALSVAALDLFGQGSVDQMVMCDERLPRFDVHQVNQEVHNR